MVMVAVSMVLLAAASVAAGAVVAVLALRRRSEVDAQERIDAAVAAVAAQLAERAAADRDAAIRQALEVAGEVQRREVGQALDAKRELIDSRLGHVEQALGDRMGQVNMLLNELKDATARSLVRVSEQLESHASATESLSTTADGLRRALASSNARGQWGERLADDLLRHAGMIEGVNYRKQASADDGSGRPDVTFLLPHDHIVYMDVKFPIDAYLRYLDATSDVVRERERDAFLRAVRERVRTLARREYGRTQARAVDHVLLFVPNESIASFIHDHDPTLPDQALSQKVILCSPLNLMALLGVIRQAIDAFAMDQRADRILSAMGRFDQQWGKFAESMALVGRRLESTTKAFDAMSTTRVNMLDRSLREIERLRADQRALDAGAHDGAGADAGDDADADADDDGDGGDGTRAAVLDLNGSRRPMGA
jgi:DNA recombination protein RmuC